MGGLRCLPSPAHQACGHLALWTPTAGNEIQDALRSRMPPPVELKVEPVGRSGSAVEVDVTGGPVGVCMHAVCSCIGRGVLQGKS